MRRFASMSAIAIALYMLSLPAFAEDATPSESRLSRDEATAVAADHGITQISEIELDDGRWEIEGRDVQGREREIEINAQSGEVVESERD
jgi:uncharacterized membrane protein YkoI